MCVYIYTYIYIYIHIFIDGQNYPKRYLPEPVALSKTQ